MQKAIIKRKNIGSVFVGYLFMVGLGMPVVLINILSLFMVGFILELFVVLPITLLIFGIVSSLLINPRLPKMKCPECNEESKNVITNINAKICKCKTCKTKFVISWVN